MGDDDSAEGPGTEQLKQTLLKSPSRLSLQDLQTLYQHRKAILDEEELPELSAGTLQLVQTLHETPGKLSLQDLQTIYSNRKAILGGELVTTGKLFPVSGETVARIHPIYPCALGTQPPAAGEVFDEEGRAFDRARHFAGGSP